MFGPAWIMPTWAMGLARGAHLAAMLSLLGTACCIAWMLPPGGPSMLRRQLRRLWWISGLIALLAGGAWFVLQAAAIAGTQTLSDLLDALPVVALHTRYGNVLLVRLGLLGAATLLASVPGRVPVFVALLLAAVALGLQGLIGHAGATGGRIGDGLVVSESLHLIAAGAWLGALLPLWLGLRVLRRQAQVDDRLDQGAYMCERFSPIGLACVLVLAGSGLAQAIELIGGIPALFGTAYGHFALLKICLFLAAVALAALNRLWLTDRLAAGFASARRHLMVSIGVETLIGLAIVTAAAFMASSPPAAHTTPVWPFSWQLSLVTVNEDPDFRHEVIVSAALIATACGLLLAALLARRFRLVALAVLGAMVAWCGPSFDLLVVEAYPTSFQVSPTRFSAASIVRGQALYGPNCAACHAADGTGQGPAAAGLRIRPADLTMPHLWDHTDGTLFWWLAKGIDDPEGGLAMPGFAGSLSDDDRWALIDYIRARNAGIALKQGPFAVRAPEFAIRCQGLPASAMRDLLGRAVLVTLGGLGSGSAVTVSLGRDADPAAGGCVAADPAASDAFAVLADEPAGVLTGTAFLIDANGWLRAVDRPDAGRTQRQLTAAVQAIIAAPIPSEGADHGHQH